MLILHAALLYSVSREEILHHLACLLVFKSKLNSYLFRMAFIS